MREIELVLLLLVMVAALATVARRIGAPYPILMLLGGLAVSAIPGTPHVELAPETVFLVFLPPLLFAAAYFTSLRDFRANARPIASLAVGLVLATAAAVAVAVRAVVPEIDWPLAFALGAIVAPPDAVAATAVLQRLGAPRRVVTILEGESLLNDATALVTYRLALAAAVSGAFSIGEAGARFVVVAIGGALLGYGVARLAALVLRRVGDTSVSITVSLVAPYLAYLPAEQLGVSGVLAAVTAGLYLGRHAPAFMSSDARITGGAVWQIVVFVLQGLIFTLLGLQLPVIVSRLGDVPPPTLIGAAAAVCLTLIAVRFVWLAVTTYVPRPLLVRSREPSLPWQATFVIGWAGMRGAVSLAAAFALPHDLGGASFPVRDLLIFVTFIAILVTLVGQGITLPFLIRRLGVVEADDAEHEEAHARATTAGAALARIDDMRERWSDHAELLEQLKALYEHRVEHGEMHHDGEVGAVERERLEHRLIRQELIDAEREAAREMHVRGAISDEVLRRIERDLDLEELRSEH